MAIVRCVLSGSFRRNIEGLERAYRELALAGCQILSPHRLHFADPQAAFARDSAEVGLSVRTIEDHHLMAIRQADFVWLHCPEGYVGVSAAMELGFAFAHGKPVFSSGTPADNMLKSYVTSVPSVFAALEQLQVEERLF